MLDQLLAIVRRVFDFRLSIAQWVGISMIIGAPYLLIGSVWTATHADRLRDLSGIDLTVSLLGSIALWPALLVADICLS